MRRPRLRLPTLLEAVFLIASVAMGWHAVVPTIVRARNSARIDQAARTLHDCDAIARHYRRSHPETPDSEITLALLETRRRDTDPEFVWPAAADLSTFDATQTNACSVRVTLLDGSSVLVTAASGRVDHAN